MIYLILERHLMRHVPECIAYESNNDQSVLRQGVIDLGGLLIRVEAGTEAGRSKPNEPQKSNEDAFAVVSDRNHLEVAVFDGASSQQPIPELGETSGARYASHVLKEEFEDPKDFEGNDRLAPLNDRLRRRFSDFSSVDTSNFNSLPTSTATVLRINRDTSEITGEHVTDSFAIAKMEDNSTELLTIDQHVQFDSKILDFMLALAHEQGITPREARNDPRIRTMIMRMFQDVRNRPDGTGEGVMNGDPGIVKYIQRIALPLGRVSALALGSDGLIIPGKDIREAKDREYMFDILAAEGMPGLFQTIKNVQDADPDRWHVRYKHADDKTGISLRFA
jgi:hypothetical protein